MSNSLKLHLLARCFFSLVVGIGVCSSWTVFGETSPEPSLTREEARRRILEEFGRLEPPAQKILAERFKDFSQRLDASNNKTNETTRFIDSLREDPKFRSVVEPFTKFSPDGNGSHGDATEGLSTLTKEIADQVTQLVDNGESLDPDQKPQPDREKDLLGQIEKLRNDQLQEELARQRAKRDSENNDGEKGSKDGEDEKEDRSPNRPSENPEAAARGSNPESHPGEKDGASDADKIAQALAGNKFFDSLFKDQGDKKSKNENGGNDSSGGGSNDSKSSEPFKSLLGKNKKDSKKKDKGNQDFSSLLNPVKAKNFGKDKLDAAPGTGQNDLYAGSSSGGTGENSSSLPLGGGGSSQSESSNEGVPEPDPAQAYVDNSKYNYKRAVPFGSASGVDGGNEDSGGSFLAAATSDGGANLASYALSAVRRLMDDGTENIGNFIFDRWNVVVAGLLNSEEESTENLDWQNYVKRVGVKNLLCMRGLCHGAERQGPSGESVASTGRGVR